MTHSGVGFDRSASCRTKPSCVRAAEVLNAGEKVAMLVGAGALDATDEVIAVADRLGAGVAKALLGKAAVPDDLPFVHRLDRAARHEAQLGADAGLRHALMVGSASRTPSSCRRRARPAACRSTSSPAC